jgi:hypothetical protein
MDDFRLVGGALKLSPVGGGIAVTIIVLGIATWRWHAAFAEQSPQSRLLEHLRQANVASQALDVAAAERELSASERFILQLPADRRLRAETLIARVRCELAWSQQAYAAALSCLDRAERLGRSWAASHSTESRHQFAEILRLRGDARAHLRNWKDASTDYQEAELLIEQLRRAGPDTAELTLAAAAVQQRRSRVEEVARNTDGVTDRLVRSTQLLDRVVQKELSSQGRLQLFEVYQRLAELCARSQRVALAKMFNVKAYDLANALYVSDPRDAGYQLALAAAKHARGKNAFAEGRIVRATVDFAGESELLEMLVKKGQTNTHVWRDYFGARSSLIDARSGKESVRGVRGIRQARLLGSRLREWSNERPHGRGVRDSDSRLDSSRRCGATGGSTEGSCRGQRAVIAAGQATLHPEAGSG